jgi:hypothetical protein
MSEISPKPSTLKIGGLSRAAQKLQSAREKAAAQSKSGPKPGGKTSSNSFKAKDSFATSKKSTFQRKAV